MDIEHPNAGRFGDAKDRLLPGTEIEVLSSFNRTWVAGFEVQSLEGSAYRVRRLHDSVVLPGTFNEEQIRAHW